MKDTHARKHATSLVVPCGLRSGLQVPIMGAVHWDALGPIDGERLIIESNGDSVIAHVVPGPRLELATGLDRYASHARIRRPRAA